MRIFLLLSLLVGIMGAAIDPFRSGGISVTPPYTFINLQTPQNLNQTALVHYLKSYYTFEHIRIYTSPITITANAYFVPVGMSVQSAVDQHLDSVKINSKTLAVSDFLKYDKSFDLAAGDIVKFELNGAQDTTILTDYSLRLVFTATSPSGPVLDFYVEDEIIVTPTCGSYLIDPCANGQSTETLQYNFFVLLEKSEEGLMTNVTIQTDDSIRPAPYAPTEVYDVFWPGSADNNFNLIGTPCQGLSANDQGDTDRANTLSLTNSANFMGSNTIEYAIIVRRRKKLPDPLLNTTTPQCMPVRVTLYDGYVKNRRYPTAVSKGTCKKELFVRTECWTRLSPFKMIVLSIVCGFSLVAVIVCMAVAIASHRRKKRRMMRKAKKEAKAKSKSRESLAKSKESVDTTGSEEQKRKTKLSRSSLAKSVDRV